MIGFQRGLTHEHLSIKACEEYTYESKDNQFAEDFLLFGSFVQYIDVAVSDIAEFRRNDVDQRRRYTQIDGDVLRIGGIENL